MVSLEFFIVIILPVAPWPMGSTQPLNGNEYQEYFLGGKGGRYVWLTTLLCRLSWKSGSLNLLEPSGPLQAC